MGMSESHMDKSTVLFSFIDMLGAIERSPDLWPSN